MNYEQLKNLLDTEYERHNRPAFVESDPIQVPHEFTRGEDIEISAFLTAQIAWGKREMIIRNSRRMMEIMDMRPYDFVQNASVKDLNRSAGFVHRTFNASDFRSTVLCLRRMYERYGTLGDYFKGAIDRQGTVRAALTEFRGIFLEGDHEIRYQRHIADAGRKSAAKRLNLFLMWMSRNDGRGVHFGLWDISPALLMIPLDIHVGRIARRLGLLKRKQNDWTAVEELTGALRAFDAEDPVKYDFALFGMGVLEKYQSN